MVADIDRLRDIETAAREYRTAWESDSSDRDAWTIANRDARARLFALLDKETSDVRK